VNFCFTSVAKPDIRCKAAARLPCGAHMRLCVGGRALKTLLVVSSGCQQARHALSALPAWATSHSCKTPAVPCNQAHACADLTEPVEMVRAFTPA